MNAQQIELTSGYSLRMGDLIGILICAIGNQLDQKENDKECIEYWFKLHQPLHIKLNLDVLFKNVISNFVEEIPEKIEHFCPGCVWIGAPYYYQKYGNKIVPKINFDPDIYTGPDLDFGNYICMSTLFQVGYNKDRSMHPVLVNEIVDRMYDKYGDKFIVISDQPHKILNKNVTKVITNNLYDLIYIISHSKGFIGGDTGFTHFAAASQPKKLISIYGIRDRHPNHIGLGDMKKNKKLYGDTEWSSDPIINTDITDYMMIEMEYNMLPLKQIKQIVEFFDGEKDTNM